MIANYEISHAEDCRRLASMTSDVDRQSLLNFIADAWQAIAEGGETTQMLPEFLRSAQDAARRLH